MSYRLSVLIFFFTDTAPTEIYTLSLHDALPIQRDANWRTAGHLYGSFVLRQGSLDRKSTRLNSSHLGISYAVFCLKKKKLFNKLLQRLCECFSVARTQDTAVIGISHDLSAARHM